jgi:hypothetical protein
MKEVIIMQYIEKKGTELYQTGENSFKLYVGPSKVLKQQFKVQENIILIVVQIYLQNKQFRLQPYVKLMTLYKDYIVGLEKSDWVKEWVKEIKECYNTLPKKREVDWFI